MSRIRHLLGLSALILLLTADYQFAMAQTQPTSNQTVELIRAELLYAHIAEMNAQDDAVKDLADSIIRNDAKALELFQGPQNPEGRREKPSGYALSPDHMEEMTRLSELSGSELDHEYLQSLLLTHPNLIHILEQNPDISEPSQARLSRDILPSLRHDLSTAKELQKKDSD